jgi:hypothetical protein
MKRKTSFSDREHLRICTNFLDDKFPPDGPIRTGCVSAIMTYKYHATHHYEPHITNHVSHLDCEADNKETDNGDTGHHSGGIGEMPSLPAPELLEPKRIPNLSKRRERRPTTALSPRQLHLYRGVDPPRGRGARRARVPLRVRLL